MTTNFGRDTSCTTSMRTGRFASGVRLVGEAAFRRLTTPRGTLLGGPDEQNYGFDISSKVGTTTTRGAVAALPGQIRAELLKDERITDVEVSVTATKGAAGADELAVVITASTHEGPFTLKLSVSELTVDLVGLTVED